MKKFLLLAGFCLLALSAAGFENYKAAVAAGNAARTAKDWDKAEAAFAEAVKLAVKESEKANALYQHADALRLAGKLAEARAGFTAMLTHPGGTPSQRGYSQLRLGEMLRIEKKFDEAIAEYAKVEAIEKATCVADARLGQAICYRSLNKHEELRQRCRDILGMPKVSLSARVTCVNMLGDSFYAEKKYAEAAGAYEEIHTQEGVTPAQRLDAYNKSGNAYNQAQQFDAAIAAFNKIIIHDQATPAQQKRAEDGLKRANDGKAKQPRRK